MQRPHARAADFQRFRALGAELRSGAEQRSSRLRETQSRGNRHRTACAACAEAVIGGNALIAVERVQSIWPSSISVSRGQFFQRCTAGQQVVDIFGLCFDLAAGAVRGQLFAQLLGARLFESVTVFSASDPLIRNKAGPKTEGSGPTTVSSVGGKNASAASPRSSRVTSPRSISLSSSCDLAPVVQRWCRQPQAAPWQSRLRLRSDRSGVRPAAFGLVDIRHER